MKKILYIASGLIIVLAVSVFFYLKSFVPDYTGSIKAPGLSAPVKIERNQFAVPTINAESMKDLYFAWGYVNAQDRMFQLEVTKRIAQGRISEFAGESTLKKDIFLRAVGFHEVAKREVKKVDPQYREYFQRYVDGINYYLDQEGTTLYMKLLGLKKELWTAADAVSVIMMLNWSLAYNMKHELLYHKMAQKIGLDQLKALLNFVPPKTPTIVNGKSDSTESEKAFYALLEDFGSLLGCRSASNNWAIADSKTAHKGTLFATDMQVHDNKLPNDFYYIRVRAGEFQCTGAQVVGAPFIVSGYNNNIAWGLTNNGADMVDLFKEKIDWEKKTYRFQGRDYPLTEKKVAIPVKGKGVVEKTLYYVKNRPILSEVFDDLNMDISLDWTAFDSIMFHGFFKLNQARNYDEFYEATKSIRISPQNCAYADRYGNIAFRVIGSQPLRNKGTGNIIHDGEKVSRNWKGNIPHDQYPSLKNPAKGYIITSNNKVVEDYPHYLNGTYAPKYRYENIKGMLQDRNDLTVEDMQTMQTDTHTVLAKKMKTIMKQTIRVGNDDRMKEAVDIVMAWDGNVSKESVAASIYNTFYVRFAFQTLKDELGDNLAEEYISERYISMERFFQLLENESNFFDDINTDKKENMSDIATRAFRETLALLEETSGSSDMKKWQWKNFHVIRYDHFLGKAKFLEPFVSYGPFPFEGDGETNNRGRFKEVRPPYVGSLASAPRMVVRFDPDPTAWMMLITGENEYFMSPHRTDMIDAWRKHEYFCMEESEVKYLITMVPD